MAQEQNQMMMQMMSLLPMLAGTVNPAAGAATAAAGAGALPMPVAPTPVGLPGAPQAGGMVPGAMALPGQVQLPGAANPGTMGAASPVLPGAVPAQTSQPISVDPQQQLMQAMGGNQEALTGAFTGAQAADALAKDLSKPTLDGFLKDPNSMAQVFGGMAQAVTASDPTSWQHQLGGQAKSLGQGGSFKDMMNSLALRQTAQLPQKAKPASPVAAIGANKTPSELSQLADLSK